MTVFEHGNRVLRGSVHWCETPKCTTELEGMKEEDRFAWNGMVALFEDAAGDGIDLDESQVRCPLEFAPPQATDPPWMGELKVPNKPRTRHWRLYFGEPVNMQDHVVKVSLWSKHNHWSERDSSAWQRASIDRAMKRLKWYFLEEGYEWSQFPTESG